MNEKGLWSCDLCRDTHPDLDTAMECCSDKFEEVDETDELDDSTEWLL